MSDSALVPRRFFCPLPRSYSLSLSRSPSCIFPGIPGRDVCFFGRFEVFDQNALRDRQRGGISATTKRIVRITHPIMTIAIVISARQRPSVKWRRYVSPRALFDPVRCRPTAFLINDARAIGVPAFTYANEFLSIRRVACHRV